MGHYSDDPSDRYLRDMSRYHSDDLVYGEGSYDTGLVESSLKREYHIGAATVKLECRFCGQTGLQWGRIEDRLTLVDKSTGEVHDCRANPVL